MSNVDEHIHFLRGLFDETSESGEQCNEIADILSRLRAELARVTAERNEARREVCFDYGPMAEALAAAKRRGWDCFDAKEER